MNEAALIARDPVSSTVDKSLDQVDLRDRGLLLIFLSVS